MSSAHKFLFLSSSGCIVMMVGVFAKPLSIQEPWSSTILFSGLVLLLLGYYWQRKAKKESDADVVVQPSNFEREKRFWIVSIFLALGMGGCLPLTPYMVENFQPWLYYYVIPGDILGLGIVLYVLRKKMFAKPKIRSSKTDNQPL